MYTTDEGQTGVELCAIVFDPPTGGAPREFFLLATSSDGTAGTAQLKSPLHILLFCVVTIIYIQCPHSTIWVWLM